MFFCLSCHNSHSKVVHIKVSIIMVFGEIIEPSTRALIDDEFEEYPEYVEPDLNWQGDIKVPGDLQTLIFIEGSKIIKLFNALVVNKQEKCSLPSGDVQIFNISSGKYVVSYIKKEIATGEVIEKLSDWITKASHIYAITEEPLSAYQNLELSEKPETLIRRLSTNTLESDFGYKKLESPNLVSGLGADVLSFSLHSDLKCILFVTYMGNSPLDSININPIIKLMMSLGLPVQTLASNLNPIASNLYL